MSRQSCVRVHVALASALPLAMWCASAAAAPPIEGADAYELVATAALDRLPIQYRSIYEPHRAAIVACAAGQGQGRFPNSPVLARSESHFVMLDAAAENASPAARLKAIRSFPRNKAEADRFMTEHNHREGGDLPWTAMAQCDALVNAIRAHNEPETARLAGVVAHLCVDVCCPYSTTTQPRGPTAGQFVLPANVPAHLSACGDARGRAWDSLIHRHRAELANAMSIEASVCDPTPDTEAAVLPALIDAAIGLDALMDLDARLVARWDIRDGEALVAASDGFLVELDRDALPLVSHRLDRASCLAAGMLIRAASEGTDGPSPSALAGTTAKGPDDRKGAGASGNSAPARPADGTAKGGHDPSQGAKSTAPKAVFVGSKNSTKFHVPTCRWAQSIKDDNRVLFSSAAEAIAAGREPCSQCEPHD